MLKIRFQNTHTCLTQFAKEGNKLIGSAAAKSKVKYHRVHHEIKAVSVYIKYPMMYTYFMF